MDSWERFGETLPDKKVFYSELNLEYITDKDYAHAQKMFKESKLKNLGDYHDLYLGDYHDLETSVLKYMNLTCSFFFCTRISMASLLKKESSKTRITNQYWYAIDGRKRN